MFKRLARQCHASDLRYLRGKIHAIKGQLRDLTAERGALLSRVSALKEQEPGLFRRFAAGVRTVASVGVAVAGGIAAYQLGQDSGLAGQMASQAVGDKSFAAAEAIGRGGPTTVAEYDELMATLRKRLETMKAEIIEKQQTLTILTAELRALRVADPSEALRSWLVGLLIVGGSIVGIACYFLL
ncbi:hypothetical protein [Geopseudomonas aromaticivorans]